MYVRIHGTRDYIKGNTQSCRELVEYLEKENIDREFLEREHFFSHSLDVVESQAVISSIDGNKKGLKDKDAKFYMLSVSPSQSELKHIAKIASGKNINHISELSAKELSKYNNLVKDYSRSVMEEYARGFNRGITGADLVYYGKLEQQRHYKGTDKEVIEGKAVSGEEKPGLQTHVHVVVSRKDKTQKLSLSPLANSRGGDNHKLNGKIVTVGIDRDSFVQKCEERFDREFSYARDMQNRYEYHKYEKNFENKVSGIKMASNLKIASSVLQSPESAKTMLVNKLENILEKSLPPAIRIPAKIVKKGMEIGLE